MRFGLDRLLASRALRKALRGKRVALLAHPASVTRDLDARARCVGGAAGPRAHGSVRSAAWPARRQAGQHGRVGGFQGSRARHPGVQPLRRRAPADRDDDGHLRRAARRPSGRRLPRLHVHYDAALRARGGGAARQVGVGARSTESRRPARRGLAVARGVGELRRRGPDTDAPRPHDG